MLRHGLLGRLLNRLLLHRLLGHLLLPGGLLWLLRLLGLLGLLGHGLGRLLSAGLSHLIGRDTLGVLLGLLIVLISHEPFPPGRSLSPARRGLPV